MLEQLPRQILYEDVTDTLTRSGTIVIVGLLYVLEQLPRQILYEDVTDTLTRSGTILIVLVLVFFGGIPYTALGAQIPPPPPYF